jgi:hypothetical protein
VRGGKSESWEEGEVGGGVGEGEVGRGRGGKLEGGVSTSGVLPLISAFAQSAPFFSTKY